MCVVPISSGRIREVNDYDGIANPGLTTSASGVDVDSNASDGIFDAIEVGNTADVIVLCLGRLPMNKSMKALIAKTQRSRVCKSTLRNSYFN
jgi:hypothetical protein